MAEDDLFVPVRRHILNLEFIIERVVDVQTAVLRGEDVREGDLGVRWVLGALLGQSFHANDFGIGEGFGPFCEEDVVLEVRRDQVLHVAAEVVDCAADARREGGGREGGEGFVLELDCRGNGQYGAE